MKLLFENWRKYLKEELEQEKNNLGLYVKEDGLGSKYGNVQIVMLDLDILKNSLILAKKNSESLATFQKTIQNKGFYENSFIGYIKAANNEGYIGALGGADSGGLCYNTWSGKEAVIVPSKRKKGYGPKLTDALLGWGAVNNIYITADRQYNSPAAEKLFLFIDKQTNDEVPPKGKQFSGYFDGSKSTPPVIDDCVVLGGGEEKNPQVQPYLNKGFKNETKAKDFIEWKDNLEKFFSTEVQALFDQPGFFEKLLGNTPENKTQNIKNNLLKIGYQAFAAAMQKHFTS